jgi:hypothetical protein
VSYTMQRQPDTGPLKRFARWFASASGVWQTATLVLAWYVAEASGFIHDNQHFQMMVWLTIFSAVTQNILAYSNRQDTEQGDLILAELRAVMQRIEAKEDQELAALDLAAKQTPSKEN